jgi:hypothetical protein
MYPLDVPCRYCGQPAGSACHSKYGRVIYTYHAVRQADADALINAFAAAREEQTELIESAEPDLTHRDQPRVTFRDRMRKWFGKTS